LTNNFLSDIIYRPLVCKWGEKMSRNKYPEETVKLILDTAAKLFAEKGYDETSLQDIIDRTNLSKGAIYHHFSSKEEIFLRVCDRVGQESERVLRKIVSREDLSGVEKLKEIFRVSLLCPSQKRIMDIVPYLLDNPKFLSIEIQSVFNEVAPLYIKPILEQGIKDGSIKTEHPNELAEALLILANVWLHPLIKPTTPEEVKARCAVYNEITSGYGFEILDEELIDTLVEYSKSINKKEKE
jgi:AcrR family transcriptional regulator